MIFSESPADAGDFLDLHCLDVQNSVACHGDAEVVILQFTVVLELEDDIHIIYLLNSHRSQSVLGIDGIYGDKRIVHLMREPRQMQPHDFIDSTHRIVIVSGKGDIVYGDMLAIQKNLFLKEAGLILYRRHILPQFQDILRCL